MLSLDFAICIDRTYGTTIYASTRESRSSGIARTRVNNSQRSSLFSGSTVMSTEICNVVLISLKTASGVALGSA